MDAVAEEPSLQDVQEAAAALRPVIDRTPLLPARNLCPQRGLELYLKAENLQRTGSFKVRGAYNRIRLLSPEQRRGGVVTASAGNHAQGVALSAALTGVPATIVMPRHAPLIKIEATRAYGAEVELVGDTFDEAMERAVELCRQRNAVFVHAFDDPAVIAGQGSIGLEILEDLPDVDVVLVPVGGGGLISGIALVMKSLRPHVRVVGVQPSGAAALHASRAAGRPVVLDRAETIADGLAVKAPQERTFRMVDRYVDDIILVDEDEIVAAMVILLERGKLLAEGAGAVAVAAVIGGKVPARGQKCVAIVSGGNVDPNRLTRVIERGLVLDGRYLRFRTRLPDQPGALHGLVGLVAAQGANIVTVAHDRLNPDVPLGQSEVSLVVETRNREHAGKLLTALESAGYRCSLARNEHSCTDL